MIDLTSYEGELKEALRFFWSTRTAQLKKSGTDTGNRSAVTGGKQMDGFANLLRKIAVDSGVPNEYIISTRLATIPGYFRPTKQWDFAITSPLNRLIACLELKSQVGSFGNNFNNRTEEALGSAVDVWTAFREGAFPFTQQPWLGYLLVVERCDKSVNPVKIEKSLFEVMRDFHDTSYLDRYKILCQRLMLERHYTSAALIFTQVVGDGDIEYGYKDDELSFKTFISSFVGFLEGRLHEFD
jgi:hypothetical protein